MKFRLNIIFALGMLLFANGVSAHAYQYQSNYKYKHNRQNFFKQIRQMEDRLAQQDRRIDQGVRSGQLTHREAQALRMEQHKIRRMINRAKSDGFIAPHEARMIDASLDRASKHIFKEKHDGQGQWNRR